MSLVPPDLALNEATPIRLLDPHTINQIAAGEVVDRPSSALKELIENALDAGASRILIDLEGAGSRKIEISDDGSGMDGASALMALQRHATSKIQRIEDLNRVATMGFRGEALPAIASVSRMTLATSPRDGSRVVLKMEGGQVISEEQHPGPQGTTILVKDLFWNTPARLKFLKSDSTELGSCIEVVSRAAFASPDVRFVLKHEGSVMIQTSGSGDLSTTVAEVWGREASRAMVALDSYGGHVRVRGLVSPPHYTKPTRSHQWIYVNGRPMRSRTLTAALDQACRSLTPEKRYPLAVLMLEVDPASVDVNVSPTKSEVKFHREGLVFDALRKAVKEALLNSGLVPSASDLAIANNALGGVSGFGGQAPFGFGQGGGSAGGFLASFQAQAPLSERSGEPSLQPGLDMGREWETPKSGEQLPDLLAGLRIIGQMDATFILAENESGMLIIDQHVAHERVIYERLLRTRGQGAVEKQPLLTPVTLSLDRKGMEEVTPRLTELKDIGFDLEVFGSDTLLVRSVPALSRGRSPLEMLKDVVDQLADGMGEGCVTPARDEVYIMCSCKMAVKAGDPMGLRDMEQLVRDLADTENPYFCPHGRPITLVFPKGEIRRRFKR